MKTFCCCIPVRFGVFLFSILSGALGLIVAVGSFMLFKNNPSAELFQKIILIASGVIYGLLFLFSVFGFFGSLFADRGLVKAYSSMLWIVFLLTLLSGGMMIASLFINSGSDAIVNQCVATGLSLTECQDALKTYRIVSIVVFVIISLVILWTCIIIGKYVTQLSEEDMFNSVKHMEHTIDHMQLQQAQPRYPSYAPVPNPQRPY